MAAGLGIALHTAGLPVGPDRCERLARAVTVMGATSVAELRACALATMVSDPGQMSTFDRVFAALFGGPSPFRDLAAAASSPRSSAPNQDGGPQPAARSQGDPGGWSAGMQRLGDRLGRRRRRRAAGRGPGPPPRRLGRRAAARP